MTGTLQVTKIHLLNSPHSGSPDHLTGASLDGGIGLWGLQPLNRRGDVPFRCSSVHYSRVEIKVCRENLNQGLPRKIKNTIRLRFSNQGLIDPDQLFDRDHERGEKFSIKVWLKN
jgi:hypothetical protein